VGTVTCTVFDYVGPTIELWNNMDLQVVNVREPRMCINHAL